MITANEKGRRGVTTDRIIRKLEQLKSITEEDENETITMQEFRQFINVLEKYISKQLAI